MRRPGFKVVLCVAGRRDVRFMNCSIRQSNVCCNGEPPQWSIAMRGKQGGGYNDMLRKLKAGQVPPTPCR